MSEELKQLEETHDDSDDGIPAVRSAVKVISSSRSNVKSVDDDGDIDDDMDEDSEEDDHISGLSSLVVKVEPKKKDNEVSGKDENETSRTDLPDSES